MTETYSIKEAIFLFLLGLILFSVKDILEQVLDGWIGVEIWFLVVILVALFGFLYTFDNPLGRLQTNAKPNERTYKKRLGYIHLILLFTFMSLVITLLIKLVLSSI